SHPPPPPPHLPSFPTRRSSDLLTTHHSPLTTHHFSLTPPPSLNILTLRATAALTPTERTLHALSRLPCAHLTGKRACLPLDRRRSEEHTSELQSLAYLVCRLLL